MRPVRGSSAAVLRGMGLALLLVLAGRVEPVAAQLASTVAEVADGSVRFAFDVRPDVEICDNGVHRGDDRHGWSSDGDQGRCWTDGLARVRLEVRGGLVRDVRLVRPSDGEPSDLRSDLGRVAAREAVDLLLSLPRAGATASGAKEAVFPAVLADVPDVWRDLVVVARDRSVAEGARKNALFWLGQEAADAVTEELSDVALTEDEDQDVREAAIFAISQRPTEQAITALMEVGRAAESAESRRTAMFWLAQFEDDRVVSFFQDVLLGRS